MVDHVNDSLYHSDTGETRSVVCKSEWPQRETQSACYIITHALLKQLILAIYARQVRKQAIKDMY